MPTTKTEPLKYNGKGNQKNTLMNELYMPKFHSFSTEAAALVLTRSNSAVQKYPKSNDL